MFFQGVDDRSAQSIHEVPIIRGFGILHVEVDHRERILVTVVLRIPGYGETVEPVVPFVVDVEEGVHHGEVGGLPEPPGAREQKDAAVIGLEDVFYQKGLVDVVFVPSAILSERQSSCVYLFHDKGIRLHFDNSIAFGGMCRPVDVSAVSRWCQESAGMMIAEYSFG